METMETKDLSLGTKLGIAMKAQGITDAELARRTGIAKQQIYAWKHDVNNMRVESLEKVAEAMGLTASKILSLKAIYTEGKE